MLLNAYVTRTVDGEGGDGGRDKERIQKHRQALEYKFKDLGILTSLDFYKLLEESDLMNDYIMCYENFDMVEIYSRLEQDSLPRKRWGNTGRRLSDYVGRQIQKGDSRVGDSSRQWEIGLPSLEVIHERRPQHYLVPAPGGPAARHGQQVEDLIEYYNTPQGFELAINGTKEVPDGLNLASSPDLPEYNFIMNLFKRWEPRGAGRHGGGGPLTMIPPIDLDKMKAGETTTMNLVKKRRKHDRMFSIHPSEGGHEIRWRKPDEDAGKSINLVKPYVNSTERGLQFQTEGGVVDVIVNEMVASTWIRGCYELLAGIE